MLCATGSGIGSRRALSLLLNTKIFVQTELMITTIIK
jgi:hypothetical protein